MIIRRFACHNCGAVSEDAAEEIYVWCHHCGSYIDYDLQVYFRLANFNPEYKAFYGKIAENYHKKETARAEGYRNAFMEIEREESMFFFECMPLFLPKPARKPGPIHDRYLEYYVQCNTERQFNKIIKKLRDDVVTEQAQYFTHTAGGPLGYTTRISAENMIKIIEENIEVGEKEMRIFTELGIADMNPCPMPPDAWKKPFISATFQGYSQFLEKESFALVTKHFHLNRSFEWTLEPSNSVCCGICGSPLPPGKKGTIASCECCGTKMERGSVGISCKGCGAPLALPPDTDFVTCPFCATVTNDATFQPLKAFEDWIMEIRKLSPDWTWRAKDDPE